MIQIELPFIKDTNAYLGLKENKSVKIKSENDNTFDDEKNNLKESTTTETKNPRIVQTSSPIEVTEIDNDSKPQKPKRKGWWSK